MSTPGAGGPQPPEQDPDQSAGTTNFGQQPPAGQPWGAPQVGQPYPGQQQPQQPWGAQQPPAGQPWGGAQPPPSGAHAFGQPEKPKRKWLPIVGGVVAVLVVLGALTNFLGAGDPEVGDCIHQTGVSGFDTVDCDSDDADFRIVGTDADMTGEEFDGTDVNELCGDFQNATSVLWYGTDNAEDGHVYCAEDA